MAKKEGESSTSLPAQELKEQILQAAVKMKASDIHVDLTPANVYIRFRIDGILNTWARLPLIVSEYENFISHLKVISSLDIVQHNIPQEGHFIWGPDEKTRLDIRSSFFPTIYGEAVVLRLLNRAEFFIALDHLGFVDDQEFNLVKELIHHPYGMLLVTGPISSGKTTTLYSVLNELVNENRNIVTLEDPVEYHLPLVRQSQIKASQGFDFATGLRSILRQDPDIVMIGEIRDFETAENAMRAALTGRLVLSTLHANTSTGTISRLIDMRIKKDLIAYALNGVIAQRLVRTMCENCRESYTPAPEVIMALQMDTSETFVHGKGCDKCSKTGFKGRTAIFEILKIDDELRRMIISESPHAEIRKTAQQAGLRTLRENGLQKIRAGITTPEEVLQSIG